MLLDLELQYKQRIKELTEALESIRVIAKGATHLPIRLFQEIEEIANAACQRSDPSCFPKWNEHVKELKK